MKFVVSTKSGKAYSASSDSVLFSGKKVGDTVKLDELGLTGFEAKITGGSDKEGFPMHPSMQGVARRQIFTAGDVGFKARGRGVKKRVTVRGNTISDQTTQLNLVVTKEGSINLEEKLGKKEVKPEDGMSAKELALQKSKELAGNAALGGGVKKPKH